MRALLLLGLAACSAADAAPWARAPELFAPRTQFRLPCWSSMPFVETTRVGDLTCHVDKTQTVDSFPAARVVCDRVRETTDPIARPMLEGWHISDPGSGTYWLGFGRDRDRPLLPTFGWQQEQVFSRAVLEVLRKDGPEYPDRPAPRVWDAWQNDDYEIAHVTHANGASWCTSTFDDSWTRWEVCYADGVITGASVAVLSHHRDPRCRKDDPICMQRDPRVVIDEPPNSWTMHTRCGDAPRLYME
ncbi:MAG: hypothetical protein M4D80_13900 [Myxococcota bacterium]|nr:hypothetical protein [Myxococcota bacterium]